MDLSKFFDNAVFQPIPAVSNVQIGIDGLYLIESIFSPKICTYENIDFQIQKNTEGFEQDINNLKKNSILFLRHYIHMVGKVLNLNKIIDVFQCYKLLVQMVKNIDCMYGDKY